MQALGLLWQAGALWVPDTAQLYCQGQAKNRESTSCLRKIRLHLFLHLHGQQSSFPCFSPCSAFEVCFRNSWSPTWILALPLPGFCSPPSPVLFGSGTLFHTVVFLKLVILQENLVWSWLFLFHILKYLYFCDFFFSFVLSCVVCLSYWLSVDLLWLPHLVSLQTVVCRQSVSANTFQQCFLWDNNLTAQLWVCRKGKSRQKKVWWPEMRFLSSTVTWVRSDSLLAPYPTFGGQQGVFKEEHEGAHAVTSLGQLPCPWSLIWPINCC